jgi:hypothetical protein
VEQDEEAAAGVHQVRVDQGVAEQAAAGQCEKAETMEESEEPRGLDGLLLEGEEQEYFLELLMRKAPPEQPRPSLATKSKVASTKGKKDRSKEKKTRGKSPTGRAAGGMTGEERAVNPTGGVRRGR